MGLARDEFLDILFLARHMASADGEFHPMEKKVLVALFKAMGVSPQEAESIRNKSSLETAIQDLQSEASKQILVDVLILVASADGIFDDDERTFIRRVMQRLHMPTDKHPYLKEGEQPDIENIRHNVRIIIENIRDLSG